MDQAATLREGSGEGRRARPGGSRPIQVVAVSSGKGGVGKTNSVVNLAVAIQQQGKKVLLLDADLGLGNIDVLLGLTPKCNLGDLLRGDKQLSEVLVDGPEGIKILPASSGVQELTELSTEDRLQLSQHLDTMDIDIDVMIIDTGAGISDNVLFFNVAAQEIVVVVSPEPTSLTDAYALMKVLFKKHGERRFNLLVNTAKTKKEGLEVFKKISLAAERFLNISVDYLGCVLYDENVPRAVVQQKAVIELFPHTKASRCFKEIAREITALPLQGNNVKGGGLQFFWRQMLTKDIETI
ncbi:MAG: MinD/ParA family protein [Proteobacteria bacterium]|nr:MinD/ParA family protein [Pseudomonadota bacterium]